MAFDGVVARAIAKELNRTLEGGKIEKVHQPEKDELVLLVRSGGEKHKLYMSCNTNHQGIYISKEDYQNPPQPSGFCMLLRKHLQGGIITGVAQKDCERIVEVSIRVYDEMGDIGMRKLIVEIMGKHSNIIFVDEGKGTIIDSVKRVSLDVNNIRQLLPGLLFEYPPTHDKIPFDAFTQAGSAKNAFEIKRDRRDLQDELLDNIQGLSPLMAREMCLGLNFDADEAFMKETITKNLMGMNAALDEESFAPRVYLKDDDSVADFHVLPIAEYEGVRKAIDFDTVSEAIAYFYSHKETSNRIKQKSTDVTKAVKGALKKALLKKQRLQEDLLEAENSEKFRLYGELLTANLHLCKTGDKSVTVTNYYDGEPLTIPLDIRYAPSKNAQLYFKKYSKAKNAIKEKQNQLVHTDGDIAYLESVADIIERATSIEELDNIKMELMETGFVRRRKEKGPKKKDKPMPFVYKSSSGLDILAGRNNKENDYLTFKVAGKNDIWFHTKDIPGSHVILFTKNSQPDDKSVYEAACIAAFHSKGQASENVPVDYTKARYVKKPNGAKPGMVIFTDNNTVYVNPKLPDKK